MFNDNDEMIEKESFCESEEANSSSSEDEIKKIKAKHRQMPISKVVVNLGNEEYDNGKTQITNDIFEGKNKTQNAALFIENFQKAKQMRAGKPLAAEMMATTTPAAAPTEKEEDQLIMDLNPETLNQKDHIFMDFFSMYGKNFINSKKSGSNKASSVPPFMKPQMPQAQ